MNNVSDQEVYLILNKISFAYIVIYKENDFCWMELVTAHTFKHCYRKPYDIFFFKSRIRESSNLSTDADRSTDTTVGWSKNTQKPKKKFKTVKTIQNRKTQKRLEIC